MCGSVILIILRVDRALMHGAPVVARDGVRVMAIRRNIGGWLRKMAVHFFLPTSSKLFLAASK